MSAYSDWKCGAISYEEYKSAVQFEERRDNYYDSDDAVIRAIEPLYNYAWSGYNERAIVGMGSFRANDAWSP